MSRILYPLELPVRTSLGTIPHRTARPNATDPRRLSSESTMRRMMIEITASIHELGRCIAAGHQCRRKQSDQDGRAQSLLRGRGLRGVATYIQSGNVLFTASRANQRTLTDQIEKALSRTFAYQSRVVVRSFEQMKATVEKAPKGFGRQPIAYRYDVIFLREPLTPDEAMKSVTTKPGVDRVSLLFALRSAARSRAACTWRPWRFGINCRS